MGGWKKDNTGDEEPIPLWQTMYCSMALIMVVLFVMLVSYSKPDKQRMPSAGADRVRDESKRIEGFRSRNFRAEEKNGRTKGPGAGGEKTNDKQTMLFVEGDRLRTVNAGMTFLKEIVVERGAEENVALERTRRGFKAVFKSTVLFPSGVTTVGTTAYPYLDRMASIAKKGPFSITVEGHTDNVPVSLPKFPSNWELSTSRAVNVLRYLIEQGGISAERLTAVGFGQYHPVASNDTTEGREKNRRIEILFELDRDEKG